MLRHYKKVNRLRRNCGFWCISGYSFYLQQCDTTAHQTLSLFFNCLFLPPSRDPCRLYISKLVVWILFNLFKKRLVRSAPFHDHASILLPTLAYSTSSTKNSRLFCTLAYFPTMKLPSYKGVSYYTRHVCLS